MKERELYYTIKEKIRINEELMDFYFSTDDQYIDLQSENNKLLEEANRIKSNFDITQLSEMALNRTDVSNKCEERGRKFIQHFHKIYLNPNDINYNHWAGEMKGWFDAVRQYTLKERKGKPLLDGDLRDWFFTACSNYEIIIKDADADELESYDKFCSALISDKEHFYDVLNKHFNK